MAKGKLNNSSLPIGGMIGQVLAKNSDTDGDASWYNLRHLPYDKWYLADGILESDVIAAYEFVNRLDEAEALVNINDGIKYPLTKSSNSITWSSNAGVYISNTQNIRLYNDSLLSAYSTVYSAIFGFHGVNNTDNGSGKIIGGILLNKARRLTIGAFGSTIDSSPDSYAIPSINIGDGTSNGQNYSHETFYNKGVIGGNWNTNESELFIEGYQRNITASPGYANYTISNPLYGLLTQPILTTASNHTVYSYYVTSLVLYKVTLTKAQHLQLSDNIHALGWID